MDNAPTTTMNLPPQPVPQSGWLGINEKSNCVTAIVIRPGGIYLDKKVKADELPFDSKLWNLEGQYVYSLIEYSGEWAKIKGKKYDNFDPTQASEQLPEELWRAVKAAPIRKVFTYKNKLMAKVNLGLAITFCIAGVGVLFVLMNMSGKGG